MKHIRLQAHRGVSSEYPENTMASFRAAVNEGYDIIELDTKFTSDDRCVILHDRKLNRTARTMDGRKLEIETEIKSCTLDMVKALDFGMWKDEKFRGEKIPTLAEVLSFAQEKSVSLKFDNVWETFPKYQQEFFLNEIKDANLGSKVGITCREIECLKIAADLFPEAELHWDGDSETKTLKEVRRIAGEHRLTIWLCFDNDESNWYKGPRATRQLCDIVREYGEVGVWKISTRSELLYAVSELDVDVIETNGKIKPFMLKEIIK